MKNKFRSLLSLVLCVAMLLSLVSALGLSVSAAGEVTTVTKTVEFTSLTENTDKTTAAESIKSVGVYDVSNMQIQSTYAMCVTPGGYQGEGYIVIELDAGDGNVFMTAPVIDLTYWLAVNSENQGYINVTGGVDGSNFPITFYSQTEGVGSDYSDTSRQYQSIALHGAQGLQTVYVKITVQHWGSMYAGAIQSVVATGYAVSAETYSGYTASSTLDFSTLSVNATEDFTAAADAITALGAEAADNLVIADCYTKFVAGKGYSGEGYYVQTLDLGEGNTFAAAPVLELNYWLASADSQGYIKVYGSVDGENWEEGTNYYEFANLNTGKGADSNLVSREDMAVVLNGAQGYQKVWVKIVIQHWGGPTCGGVVKSIITGTTTGAVSGGDTGEEETTEAVSNVLDFSDLTTATEDFTAAAAAIVELGAVEANNLIVANITTNLVAGKGYSGEGYYIQKLTAGAGKVFADTPVLDLDYRLATNTGNQGYVKVEMSLDGETYTQLAYYNEGLGANYTQECYASASIALTGAAGYRNVYVKVTMQHWTAPDGAGVDYSALSATATKGVPPVAEEKPRDLSSVLDFSTMTADGTLTSRDEDIVNELGAVASENLAIVSHYSVMATPTGGYTTAYFVQQLDAGDGYMFESDPSLVLDYRIANGSGSITVEASYDGGAYEELATLTESTGTAYQESCKASVTLPLAATGYQTVKVKVTVIRYGGEPCGAVDRSAITGTAVAASTGNYTSEIDFTSLTKDENATTAIDTILAEGAYDADNLYLSGSNSVTATPGGYNGVGYVALKVSAAKGATLDSVTLNLKYWAYNADTSVDPGYLTIAVSNDGTNYTDIQTITATSSLTTVQEYSQDLLSLRGATTAYVKVSMEHWESYEGAALEYIGLASQPNDVTGDINRDTFLSDLDVDYLRGAVLGSKRQDMQMQDMNADGAVNVCDVVTRMRYQGDTYAETDSDYVVNFSDVALYGEASDVSDSTITTSGTVSFVSAGNGVTGGPGDYSDETYGYVQLGARNSYVEFTMAVPTTGTVTLDIEEIHERNDALFYYSVQVNGTTVGSTRSYDPNSTGPNHHFVEVPASVHGGAETMTVRITYTYYASSRYVRIRRVWALPDVEVLAESQGVASKMKLGIMLPEVPTTKTVEQLKSLVQSYQAADSVYEVSLCWELNYITWGKEGTESQIDYVLNAVSEIGVPLYLGINSWWGGTPIDGMDGQGGSWSDPVYSQVTYDTTDGTYSLTTPNEFSDTPWNTMNNDNYNTVRAERIKETIAYIQRRSTEMTMSGTSLPTVHLYTENEPYYWPLNWAKNDNTGEYGDFNAATVADAAADGVTLNPADGLSDTELDWLFENLHTYISEVGDAFMEGAGTNYITIENGNVTYPDVLLTDKSYTHTMLATSLYTGHDVNERAWENHILDTIHMGGEYNDVLAATRDSQPSSGSMDNMIEDLRALQYMASYGSHANVNCEYIGMEDGFEVIPQYYAYGVDGLVVYNITNSEEDFAAVKAESSCGSETVSGTSYTCTQLRTRYQMVEARADAERLLARYGTQDDVYARAAKLYAEARYGEAISLLSAALSKRLTADSAVDFMVQGYGQLADYPVYVETSGGQAASIRLLEVSDNGVKFEFNESDAQTIKVTLLNASGNYTLNKLDNNLWEIVKSETGTAAENARVTFDVSHNDGCPKTVIGEISGKGETYLQIRTEDEAVGGYSYFRTFGWTGGNSANVTVTRTAFGASTTAATVSDLQVGDYVCMELDDDYNIKSIEAQYLTVTGTINSITPAQQSSSSNVIANPIVNMYIPVYGASFNIEVGGDTKLIYSGSTTYLRNYDATGTFGLSTGDTITVAVSLYNQWYYGGNGNRTDGCYRAQSITK